MLVPFVFYFPIFSTECVLLSCLLLVPRLPVSEILCCVLVMLCETYCYVFWFYVYGLFLLTVPPSELMVWIIEVLEDSVASFILSVVCCC